MNSEDSQTNMYNDANETFSATKQRGKSTLLKKEISSTNTKYEKYLLYSKSLRFPLNFKQNNSLKYYDGLFTLVGDSNMKTTIQSQVKIFDQNEINEGKSGLVFELNTGSIWQSLTPVDYICKTDNDVGFIESLNDAHVIRSIQDGNTYWRVVLLFADGNMIIQDYKQISQQREDREVELTGQWHINSILQESKSVIETFQTLVIDKKTKIKTKEHESLKEYFNDKNCKHEISTAISFF